MPRSLKITTRRVGSAKTNLYGHTFSDPNQQYGGGGGYPPQQPGYPPQQPGYPPGGAFPMHGGYPPPQGGPYGQQGGYGPPPPQGGPYGQQGGYGPPPNAGFMPPQDPYGYQPHDGGYSGGDPEDPKNSYGFDDATIRRGFIRKVYSILMVSHRWFILSFVAILSMRALLESVPRSH